VAREKGAAKMSNDQGAENPEVWILDRGSGAQAEPEAELRAAAIRVWPRADAFAKKESAGSSLAGERSLILDVWEETLQSVSKRLRRRRFFKPLTDIDSYLFVAFAHKLKEALRKETSVEFVGSNDELEALKPTQDWSWVDDLEDALELKALVDSMDDVTKSVLHRWALDGDPWGEIAKDLGVTPNAAKKRFFYRLRKVRERVRGAGEPANRKA
jgi:DNA-directed RNA polymerase specialized sigma24 family protein